MRIFKRVLLMVLALSLLISSVGVAATLYDGTWSGTVVASGGGTRVNGAKITGVIENDEYRAVAKGKSSTGKFQLKDDGTCWAMITLDGTVRQVPGTYSYNAKATKLTIKLSYTTVDKKTYKATVVAQRATPKPTKLAGKRKKPDKVGNLKVQANKVTEYVVLTDDTGKILAITTPGTAIPYTWAQGKNKFVAYGGSKDVKGNIPILSKVGDILSEADKLLLGDAKSFTKKSKK